MVVQNRSRGVTFVRQGLPKSDRPNYIVTKIFVQSFKEDKNINHMRVLSEVEKKGSFLSINK